jgi:hypothetical protein
MKLRPGVVPQWPPRLYVLELERLLEQRIVEQIDLSDGEIVGGPPPGVDQFEFMS